MKKGVMTFVMTVVGVVIGILLLYTVLQPTLNSVVTGTSGNLQGYSTAALITNQLPTFNAIAGLALLAGLIFIAFRAQ